MFYIYLQPLLQHKMTQKVWGSDCYFGMLSPLQVVEERCVYRENPENNSWTEVKREAWVSSRLFGVSRAIQVRKLQICVCMTEKRLPIINNLGLLVSSWKTRLIAQYLSSPNKYRRGYFYLCFLLNWLFSCFRNLAWLDSRAMWPRLLKVLSMC